jgi:choline dehydrogenase-like flavoprotein
MPQYDAIVIGAGVGGSNVAAGLAAAGLRCLVLEAGRYWSRLDYPRGELAANTSLYWNNGAEINTRADLALLRARAVGGGSIVNQALLDEFDEVALDDWRERTGFAWLSPAGMAPWYEAAKAALRIQRVPVAHANRNAHLFRAGFRRCGFQCKELDRAYADCRYEDGNDCIACLSGCALDSKQSTPVTSLQQALKAGCQLLTECEVEHVSEGAQHATVHARLADGQPLTLHTQRVVLAAGTLGTNSLLLRGGWQRRLPTLGHGFYCHPQFMVFARYREPVDAHRGAFQAYKSDDAGFRRAGFKLENVFSPPIGVAMLLPGFGRTHLQTMAQLRHLACIEVAVHDTHPGRVRLGASGRLEVDKELDAEDGRRARAGLAAIDRIFRTTGATEIIHGRFGIGLHLMGGLRLAQRPDEGCVGEDFRLFGSQRIYAADGSLFPAAPGINPSLTIMALARRAAAGIVAEAR